MKKVLIVIDSCKKPECDKLGVCLKESFEKMHWMAEMIDLQPGVFEYTYFHSMIKFKPDFLVTLNLAGFTMKTDAEETSLNRIPCRMAHLMLHSYEGYEEVLKHTINFSMYFFTGLKETALQMQTNFPHIEHISCLEELITLQKNKPEKCSLQADVIVEKILHITEF
ncbi:MAG TPA: hypothetical protein VJY54_11350 [Lachnospiraceae bacterium]|nr:hypothetical protein [Lachnospiraceae bacterium]